MSAKQMLFVVDDDKQLLSAMEMIFAQFYELECFTSATACLQRVAEKTPDLFMLAVDLPKWMVSLCAANCATRPPAAECRSSCFRRATISIRT
jgi:FixJ family two-component response regulator